MVIPAGLILALMEVDRKLAGAMILKDYHSVLHIGVGGSPENWGHNVHTPTLVDKGKRFYIDVHYSASSWNAPSYFTKVRSY